MDAWDVAYEFHQKGFHEELLTIDQILKKAYKIEDLIKMVEKEARKPLKQDIN